MLLAYKAFSGRFVNVVDINLSCAGCMIINYFIFGPLKNCGRECDKGQTELIVVRAVLLPSHNKPPPQI